MGCKRKLFNTGFSLIELMIVIAIIGVLAAIAVPSYQNYIRKSRVATALSFVDGAKQGIAEYVQTTGDPNCTNLFVAADNQDVPLDNFYYGYSSNGAQDYSYVASNSCIIEIEPLDSLNELGGYFNVFYVANVTSDGTITWQCKYTYFAGGVGTSANFAPDGCVNAF